MVYPVHFQNIRHIFVSVQSDNDSIELLATISYYTLDRLCPGKESQSERRVWIDRCVRAGIYTQSSMFECSFGYSPLGYMFDMLRVGLQLSLGKSCSTLLAWSSECSALSFPVS